MDDKHFRRHTTSRWIIANQLLDFSHKRSPKANQILQCLWETLRTPPCACGQLLAVHFEADQFEKPDVEGKIKLKRSAVPTLFAHKKPLKKRPPLKIRSSPPKKQKIHSEVLKNETEEEDIDQVQPDDSELVAELKIKLKIITDENRRLRSQLSVLNKTLTSFLKEGLPENFCPDS